MAVGGYTGKRRVDEPGATGEAATTRTAKCEWPTSERAARPPPLDAKNGGVYVFGRVLTPSSPTCSKPDRSRTWLGRRGEAERQGLHSFPDDPCTISTTLWVYNLTAWLLDTARTTVVRGSTAAPRTDMSMILDMGCCRSSVDDDGACFGPMLIVFGGYNGRAHRLDDTWLARHAKDAGARKSASRSTRCGQPGCTLDDDEIIANSSLASSSTTPSRSDRTGSIQAQRHDLDDLFGE